MIGPVCDGAENVRFDGNGRVAGHSPTLPPTVPRRTETRPEAGERLRSGRHGGGGPACDEPRERGHVGGHRPAGEQVEHAVGDLHPHGVHVDAHGRQWWVREPAPVSYTHLTLPTN